MKTIIYTKGGDNYSGEYDCEDLDYWKMYGKSANQKYMYKGYRYWTNSDPLVCPKDIVIVFDTMRWSRDEKARRKANGFLGIQEYIL